MSILAVNYHYIAIQNYPFSGIHSINYKTFLKHLNYLKKNFILISPNDLGAARIDGRGRYCLMTFDDGLKCHYEKVFPLMVEHSFPAAFFVSSRPLIEHKATSVHKSQIVRALIPPDSFIHSFKQFILENEISIPKVPEGSATSHYRYDLPHIAETKYILNYLLNEKQKNKFIDSEFSKLYPNEEEFVEQWYMNGQQIKEMNDRFHSIGSHSHSHGALAQMQVKDAREELEIGKRTLENITGIAINCLSYPFGNESAVGRREAELAEKAGFEFAFTMEREANATLGDPLLLARIDCNDLPLAGKSSSIQIHNGRLCRPDGSESRRTRYFSE